MPDIPSSVSLTEIADGAEIVAATHRNNYTAVQTAINALRAALAGGTDGQLLRATDADTVGWQTMLLYANVNADGTISSSSSGVTVSHPSTGNYNVDFPAAFVAGVANPVDTAPSAFTAVSSKASTTRLQVGIQTVAGVATDRAFAVIAFAA